MMEFAEILIPNQSRFIDILGLQNLLAISDLGGYELESWYIFFAIMLALCVLTLSLIVMIMFIVILVGRVIMFMILTILSPLAFLASAIPGGNRYFGMWWGEFTKYLITGPVLAFFTY